MKIQRQIKLVMPWALWSPGHVFTEMPNGQAAELVARGFAEYVDEQVKSAPVNRMMARNKQTRATAH